MEKQNDPKIRELEQKIEQLMEEKSKKDEENIALKEQNENLQNENCELKEMMAKMDTYMKKKKISFPHLRMSSELIDELFGSLPFENAFDLLTKMPNGLLARNVQKMINCIKMAMKNNKINIENIGTRLVISEDGFAAKHSGPNGWNCIRTVLPIPIFNLKYFNKPIVAFYFEVQIINKPNINRQFSLGINSIGIVNKGGILIERSKIEFENCKGNFKNGNFVGLGIIYRHDQKLECFATWNGELLGRAELTEKFAKIDVFPAVNLYYADESISRTNFGKEEWQFKKFEHIL